VVQCFKVELEMPEAGVRNDTLRSPGALVSLRVYVPRKRHCSGPSSFVDADLIPDAPAVQIGLSIMQQSSGELGRLRFFRHCTSTSELGEGFAVLEICAMSAQ